MTTRTKRSAKSSRIEALVGDARELLKGRLKESLPEVLEAEMTEAVGAGPGERTTDRVGYRSGYDSRGVVTRTGKVEFWVPRDREGRFSTERCDRFHRSETALVSAFAEMYVQGGLDPQGQGGHRRALRAHVVGEYRQPDQSEPGWPAPALCAAAAGGGVSRT